MCQNLRLTRTDLESQKQQDTELKLKKKKKTADADLDNDSFDFIPTGLGNIDNIMGVTTGFRGYFHSNILYQ